MSARTVQLTVADGVGTITICREERRNAIGITEMGRLRECLAQATADPAVRCIVLTGAGEKAFCAGGDLTSMQGTTFLEKHEGRAQLTLLFQEMFHCGKPIVARVNGYAYGGGFGLLCACDLAICADDVKMGTPEIKRGLFPMMIMPVIFRNVGRKAGLELILTGERIGAEEAWRLGLVNRVVPRGELDGAVAGLCSQLTSKSAAVMKLGKDAYYAMSDMTIEQAFQYLKTMITANTLLEDAAEGIASFFEKREPEWKDR